MVEHESGSGMHRATRRVGPLVLCVVAMLLGRPAAPVAAQAGGSSTGVAGSWCAARVDLRADVQRACTSSAARRACVRDVPVFERIALAVSSTEVRASYGSHETVAPLGGLAVVEESSDLLLERGYEIDGGTLVEHTRVNEGDIRSARRFTRDGESLLLELGVTRDWGEVVVTHRYHRCE